MEVQLESGSIHNGGEIANNLNFSKADISILNAELVSMDEIKESLYIKTTNIQKSCCDQNVAELFLEISNELGMISHRSENIKTILNKIKIYTEKYEDLREETKQEEKEEIKAENAGKLRLVPLEKLIAKTAEDEHIKETVFMHSYKAKNDPVKVHISEIAIKTSSKPWKACCVRIKRLQVPACMKNNIVHKMAENNKANSIITTDGNTNGHKENAEDSPMTDDTEIPLMKTKKRQIKSLSESEESSVDTNFKKEKKKLKKTRPCRSSDSSDEECEGKRKNIRKLIKTKNLETVTKEASFQEEQRRKRVEERQKMYNEIYSKPENIEINEVALDFNEDTKETLLEVDKSLLKHLKPHQVSGIKFMWDACFETVKDCKQKSGSGCILAHCMGLGKTLQIVALTHTLFVNSAKTGMERFLIISPLSTLGNWAREFAYWIEFAENKDLDVYDLSKYKDKSTRIFKLKEWVQGGGVCIVGYDMYRILSNEKTKGLTKKHKETLQKSLVNPGPDLVVCDEGHLLKNEKTSLSQAVSKIRTQRRIVLTGTPLQNNLKEYYCMIQFIKPNLLGTYKEYLNRFVNPITNGQYTNSTAADIRLMKHRSHILHKMLEGCIQRRDYSVLAPYLPPKHEYVVFVTLSDAQKKLYHYYMTKQEDESSSRGGKGAKLFEDFQYLRRIATHPMNLRLNSDRIIRKNGAMEQKVYERQVIKQATAKRVIDEQQISRHYNQSDLQELYKYELTPTLPRETPKLPKDRLFADLLSDHQQLIYKYHEHDSLLENEESENLSEDERKAAWDEYEAEKNRPQLWQNALNSRPAQENYGHAFGSLTSNKILGIRNDIFLRLLNIKISQDQPQLTTNQRSQLVPGYLQKLFTEMRNGDKSMYEELMTLHNSLHLSNELYLNPLSFSNPSSSSAAAPMIIQPNWQNEIHQRKTPFFDADHVYEID